MKLEPCIILKLFLNFSDSLPEYSYKFYTYKHRVYSSCCFQFNKFHPAIYLSQTEKELRNYLCLSRVKNKPMFVWLKTVLSLRQMRLDSIHCIKDVWTMKLSEPVSDLNITQADICLAEINDCLSFWLNGLEL